MAQLKVTVRVGQGSVAQNVEMSFETENIRLEKTSTDTHTLIYDRTSSVPQSWLAVGSMATIQAVWDTAVNASGGGATLVSHGALIDSATGKTTPVNGDYVGLMDSAASNVLKKLSWANIKATLKTYFDTLYTAALLLLTGYAKAAGTISAADSITGAIQKLDGNDDLKVNLSGSNLYAAATGTDTYAATLTPAVAAYVTGLRLHVSFANTNTTAATLNVNGLGAKSLKKDVATALSASDIVAGKIYTLFYDGTNFQFLYI